MLTFGPRPQMLRLMGDLADLLEHGDLPGEFNMEIIQCGTAACAFGWGYQLLPSWKKAGILGKTQWLRANIDLQLSEYECAAAFIPSCLHRRGRKEVARRIRWLVEREQRRQADEHVRRLNRLAKCAAWGMDREALIQRARERRRVTHA